MATVRDYSPGAYEIPAEERAILFAVEGLVAGHQVDSDANAVYTRLINELTRLRTNLTAEPQVERAIQDMRNPATRPQDTQRTSLI